MVMARKQADNINDLEAEMSNVRKQERSYEEAINQLQHDLDALEQDNMKPKAWRTIPNYKVWTPLHLVYVLCWSSRDWTFAASAPQPTETETLRVEGKVESCNLLEQVSEES